MRRWILIVGVAFGLGAGAGTWPGSGFAGHDALSPLLEGVPVLGSHVFLKKGCLRCHAIYGEGGTAGPDLGRITLTRPLLEVAGVMWNHSPEKERALEKQRVAEPQFTVEEMASLLSFLYYLGSMDPPRDPAVGAVVFRQKGCQICHALEGRGGDVGPELDKYSRYASPLFLTAALWKKGKAMAEKMKENKVPRPTFQENDIPNLLAFIQSTGRSRERVYALPGIPMRGEEIFTEKRCIECHSLRGHGGKVGPDLGIKLKGSLMQIAGAMWNHGLKMWAKMAERGIEIPSLSPEELSDLISYLYFFQFIDPPGDVERGRAVYKEIQCGTCHPLQGVGGTVGPDLAKVEEFGTPIEVVTEMWNHASKVEEKVAWSVFKGGEMADLIAYLRSVRGGTSPAAERR